MLTLVSKFETNTFSGPEFQPSASLLWNRSAKDTIWVSFARASRSPSRLEHDVVFTAFAAPGPGPASSLIVGELQGNREVGSERVLA